MKRLAAATLALSLAFAAPQTSVAKTPPEVLQPYKAYRAALKAGDTDEALKQARAAWEEAEALPVALEIGRAHV